MAKWRLAYYAAWLAPTLIAAFANYTVAVNETPDASWTRYFIIHLFYWGAWAFFAEIIYRAAPDRFAIQKVVLVRFGLRQGVLLAGILIYFAVYYRAINPSQFAGSNAMETISTLLTRSGPVVFHVMTATTFVVVLVVALMLRQSAYARRKEEEALRLSLAQRRLEASLAESRLLALNSQIHPHFLFNAMNNIAALIETQKNDRAYEGISLLAQLLRKTFLYAQRATISLAEELELAKAILDLGALRFGDRLRWNINCADHVKKRSVPPFLIQPLVENALRHSIESADRVVTVSVDIEESGEGLRVVVEDDGVGCGSGALETAGLGLANLRERLSLISGRSLTIRTSPGEGFAASFVIP